jgi:hypothetical protein
MRIAVLVLVVGCGLDLDEYQAAQLDAHCGYLVRCGAISTVADCRSHFRRNAPDSPNIAAGVDAGKLRYDEDAAQDCIDAYGALSCDTTKQSGGALDACDRVLTGTVADGGSCAFDLECSSTYCSVPVCEAACCTGTCKQPMPLPGVGEPCTSLCAEDAYCAVDSTCHALLPEGAACDGFSLCAASLYCVLPQAGGSGVCTPLPHIGEACAGPCAEINAACLYELCYAVGLAGDPCKSQYDCAQYYTCGPDQKCARLPTLGMPCFESCSDTSYCDGTTCVDPKANNETCASNDQCTSRYCDKTGRCADVPLCI